jgi:hypothetical protein
MEKSAIEILLEKVTKENVELKKQLTDARRYGNLEANKASRFERQVDVLVKELGNRMCVECSARSICLHSAGGITCGEAIKQWSLAEVKEEDKL